MSETSCCDEAQRQLVHLLHIRDNVYPATAANKEKLLRDSCAAVLAALPAAPLNAPHDKALAIALRGRALEAASDDHHDARAEDMLVRAVKLRPDDTAVWNALGHALWKRGALRRARLCFEEALERDVNVESLRHLSQLLRLSSPPDHSSSVLRAKEAVALDIGDARAWESLGNAHFGHGHPAAVERALAAYRRAVVLADGADPPLVLPELHYNFGVALKYKQRFADSLRQLGRAAAADPLLVPQANQEVENIVGLLRWCSAMVARKGGLRPKRLKASLASGVFPLAAGSTMAELALGFAGEGKGEGAPDAGTNNVRLGLKLLAMGPSQKPPYPLVMVDRDGACVVVALYAVHHAVCARWTESDVFSIAVGGGVEVQDLQVPLNVGVEGRRADEEANFPLIVLEDPRRLAVNGQRVPDSAITSLSSQTGTGAR